MTNDYRNARHSSLSRTPHAVVDESQRSSSVKELAENVLFVGTEIAAVTLDGLRDAKDFVRGNSLGSSTPLRRTAAILATGLLGAGIGYSAQAVHGAFAAENSQGTQLIDEMLKNESAREEFGDAVVPQRTAWVTESLEGFITPEASEKLTLVGSNPEKYRDERQLLVEGFDALATAGQMADSKMVDQDPVLEGQFTTQLRIAADKGLIDPAILDAPLPAKIEFGDSVSQRMNAARNALVTGPAIQEVRKLQGPSR
jgi:hypothetical protein